MAAIAGPRPYPSFARAQVRARAVLRCGQASRIPGAVMNPLDDALTALERVTGYRPVKSGDGYKARCPCHEDRNPSLSVKMNGRLLLHCFAGCSYDRIVAALGLTPELPSNRREIVATYR